MINIVACIIHGACYTNERIIIQFRIHDVHVIVEMYLALVILIVVIIVIHIVMRIVHIVNDAAADADVWRRQICGGGWCWRNS